MMKYIWKKWLKNLIMFCWPVLVLQLTLSFYLLHSIINIY
jgi:hypothetical protein